MSIWGGLFSGSDSPFYYEHTNGPLIARQFHNMPPGEVAKAYAEVITAFAELMVAEDIEDGRDIPQRGPAIAERRRAVEASARYREAFAKCDGYLADWTGGNSVE